MTREAEEITMRHGLNHARQNAILSNYSWCSEHEVRVECTHRTEALLRLAGVARPEPLKWYAVPVKRDNSGFLVVDHEPLLRKAAADEMRDFRERMAAGRAFEVPLGPTRKAVVSITVYEDEAPPTPLEPERWKPERATETDVFATVHALATAREREVFELPADPNAAA